MSKFMPLCVVRTITFVTHAIDNGYILRFPRLPRKAAESDAEHVCGKLLFQGGKSFLASLDVFFLYGKKFVIRAEDLETGLQFCSKNVEQVGRPATARELFQEPSDTLFTEGQD